MKKNEFDQSNKLKGFEDEPKGWLATTISMRKIGFKEKTVVDENQITGLLGQNGAGKVAFFILLYFF